MDKILEEASNNNYNEQQDPEPRFDQISMEVRSNGWKEDGRMGSNEDGVEASGVNFKGVMVFVAGCVWMVFLSS